MEVYDASDGPLWEACRKLPSDWEPHGKRRWLGPPQERPDCTTCRWFTELFRTWPDWGVCANAESVRAGLLTIGNKRAGSTSQGRSAAVWRPIPHAAISCGHSRRSCVNRRPPSSGTKSAGKRPVVGGRASSPHAEADSHDTALRRHSPPAPARR